MKIKELTKTQEIIKFIEELEVQLSLGKAEAIDEIEKQKVNLKQFIDETLKIISGTKMENHLKSSLEEIQLQLALGKAETKEKLEEQIEKILKSISLYKSKMELLKDDLKDKYPSIEHFDKNADKLKMLVDIAKLQFHLGKAELKEEVEKDKDIFLNKLKDFKFKIGNDYEITEDRLESFKEGIYNAFDAFKSGLTKFK